MGSKHLVAALGLAAALTVPLAACGSSGKVSDGGSSGTPSAAATSMVSAKPAVSPFGVACSKIPTDPTNQGSTTAMEKEPVATAASGLPWLSTLVSLVKKEKLVDTLNGVPQLTVFAPVNDAFTKIPKSTMSKLTDQQIVSMLKLHAVGERLSPGQVAGSHKTLNGASVTVSGSGDSFTVQSPGNKTRANVVCGNVQTANATMYLIDTVLMPATS